MNNHFHLVVETPKANLADGMKWLLGIYTARFNRQHRLFGHLFSGRYKSLVVDNSGNGYFKTVCVYVHLNPVRAHLLQPDDPLQAFAWSSYREYLRRPTRRVTWLRVERLLGEMGIGADSAAGRREFARRMEASRRVEVRVEYRKIRRGWCYGEEAFRRELLLQASQQNGGTPLRGGAEGKRGGQGGAVGGGIERSGLEEIRFGQAAQGRPGEDRVGAAVEAGNDHATQMDL